MTVKRGSVWVTQDGNREDVVLEAGQTMHIDGNETVIVFALRAAEVRLDEPRQRSLPQRVWRGVLAAASIKKKKKKPASCDAGFSFKPALTAYLR